MKGMYAVLLGIAVMALFALTVQDKNGGFIKVGKNLYETKGPLNLKPADRQKLLNLLADAYNVNSFAAEVKTIWDHPKKGGFVKPGFAMSQKKIDAGVFQYQLMYDGETDDVCQRCVNCGDGCDGRKSTKTSLELRMLLEAYDMAKK